MRYSVKDPEATVESTVESTQAWKSSISDNMKKSKKEKTMCVVMGFLLFAVIGLGATLFLKMSAFKKNNRKEICPTKLCVETASRVLDSMNDTIDPCDDFYEFACRGWMTKNPIPRGFSTWDPLGKINRDIQTKLKKIITATTKKQDKRPIRLARKLYATCMDEDSVEKLGLKPLHDAFKKLDLPRKPPSDNLAKEYDVSEIVGTIQRFNGLDIFIDMFINQDIENNTQNRLKMTTSTPSLIGLEKYLRDPVRYAKIGEAQKHYMNEMLKLAGAGDKSEQYTTELMDFMTKLVEIMTTTTETAHDVTIEQLQQVTDLYAVQWNWTTYMTYFFKESDVVLDPKKDTVIVFFLERFRSLPVLLNNTPRGTIVRYIWWEVYSSIAPRTKEEFRKLKFELEKVVHGVTSRTPRPIYCARIANAFFGMAITAAYVKEHFTVQEKKKAIQMWSDVSASFDEMLNELHWMDSDTKEQAHRKLLAIRPFIGYPAWITNDTKLEKYYKEFEVFEGRLYETYLHFNLIIGRYTLNSLRKKPNRNRWVALGTTVNAFYWPLMNSVTFPAGILHKPLYGNGVEALNYGAIGAIMGHELTHGFDNRGRLFDGDGNYRQWWSEDTLKLFEEKVECMIKQYSGYEITQLGHNYTVNGNKTQNENIADNGGLREAFRAYKKLKARSKPQQSLPGLVEYTDEQLFFLGFAQVWCGSETDEALKEWIAKYVHTPNRYRVMGTLQNNAEFSKVWKCHRGSPMNPKHKCVVW